MIKKRCLIIFLIFGVFFFTQNLEAAWTLKRLTWNPGDSYSPSVATDSNNYIYVVWQDETPGNYEIFYKKSTDGGATWALQRLTWNSGDSYNSAITSDSNNNIHVVWSDDTYGDNEIFYKQSTDGGATWALQRLTWNSGSSNAAAIASDSNNHIHVVWQDDTPGNREIFYKQSTDGGATWTLQRLTWSSNTSAGPDIAIDSNNHIHVVWHDYTPGNYEIFYKKSTDGGATWTLTRLTWNSSLSYNPAVAVDSNNHIHVVYYDSMPGNSEIFYKKSTDGGATWTLSRLTWNSESSLSPAIATDSNNYIHVIWLDNNPGNYEIFYKQSIDGGTSWNLTRLTWNSGYSGSSAIASSSNNHIHVVWYDDTPGNFEIFYKKKD